MPCTLPCRSLRTLPRLLTCCVLMLNGLFTFHTEEAAAAGQLFSSGIMQTAVAMQESFAVAQAVDESDSGSSIRATAVLQLSFNNGWNGPSAGPGVQFQDEAAAGAVSDVATLVKGGTRLPAVFAPQDSGSAVLLRKDQQQILQVAHSADLDRPDAVTISGMFANLHPLTDAGMYGLFAKRQPAAPAKTNYGINYSPSTDAFQVYVNDGSGFKVAVYSVKATIGFRRRVHLAATFLTGDAPGADTDTDADDVQIRLFVNGVAATPVRVTAGLVDGTTAWLQDVQLANCCSDTPLTVGGSFLDGELADLICDDLQLFPTALNDDQARQLFQESAGSEAAAIAGETSDDGSVMAPIPVIARLSQYGLTVGQKTQLTVFGRNLNSATAQMTLSGVQIHELDGDKPNQRQIQIEVPSGSVPGHYQLRMCNERGISRPVVIAVDGYRQLAQTQISDKQPVTELPVAVSGLVSGTEQIRVHFVGRSGEAVVAEIEARRIGSRLDPVVEIKTDSGTPLAVQWQQPHLGGDARAVATLPADGTYFVEIHDLQYRAAANSPFRLLLGNIPESGIAYPPAIGSGDGELRTAGLTGVSEPVQIRASGGILEAGNTDRLAPLPAIALSDERELTEPLEGTFDPAPVDASFTVEPFPPLYVNGRITTGREEDQIVLTVTPGQSLRFDAIARSINSPLHPVLALISGDAQVAYSDGDSGSAEPFLQYTVPENVTQLTLKVRDFTGRGSPGSIYRIQIARSDRPDFELHAREETLRLPINGAAPLHFSVIRQSPSFRYTGPIRLAAEGMHGISLVPEVIPASDVNQEILVVVTHRSHDSRAMTHSAPSTLRIVGETTGTSAKVLSAVQLHPELVQTGQTTFESTGLLASASPAMQATVALNGIPPVLLRGLPTSLPLRILPLQNVQMPFVRFELMTTERERPSDPNNPKSAPKPPISASKFQFASTDQSEFVVHLDVPLDVAESSIDAVVGARFVSQPLESGADQVAWTAPVTLAIENAVRLQTIEQVRGPKGSALVLSGTVLRHPQFTDPVIVSVEGLPAGVTATSATLEPDQTDVQISITVPDTTATGELPNVTVQVRTADGRPLLAPTALKVLID